MAWKGLTLTADGRDALTEAQIAGMMNINSIVVGDGSPPGNYENQKKLVHQLFEITNIRVEKTGTGCIVQGDFPVLDYDYYFREIGIIVNTPAGGKLYVYDNTGTDAEHIIASAAAKEAKRVRLNLVFSGVAEIKVETQSVLYVDYEEYEKTVESLKQLESDVSLVNTVSGTGSVSTPDAADAEIRNIVIKGRSVQDTTTGTQMFDASALASPSPGRFLLDITEKGRVIRVSSPTETSYANAEMYDSSLIGKTFYMMVDNIIQNIVPAETLKPAFQMAITLVDDQVTYYNLDVSSKRLITVPSDAKTVRIRLLSNNSSIAAVSDVSFIGARICLADNTPWEEYTGGKASPNTQYLQEIRSVTNPLLVSSVGGRNLISNSMFDGMKKWSQGSPPAWSVLEEGVNSCNVLGADLSDKEPSTTSYRDITQEIPFDIDHIQLDKPYTVSLWVNVLVAGTNRPFTWYMLHVTGQSGTVDNNWTPVGTVTNGWQKFSRTFKFIDNPNGKVPRMYLRCFDGSSVKVAQPKMEPGENATPWTPVVKDITEENADRYRKYISLIDLTDCTLRGFDDIRDRIFRSGSVWKFNKIMLSVFGRDLTWAKFDAGTEFADSFCARATNAFDSANYAPIMSNGFSYVGNRILAENIEGVYIFDKTIRCRAFSVTSLAEFVKAIADVEFLFPLSNSVLEPFPENVQEKLNNLRTYEGEHSCLYVVSDVPADLEVEYYSKTPVTSALFPAVDRKISNSLYSAHKTRLVTLEASGWVTAAVPYSYMQTVAVEGLTEDMEPILVKYTVTGMTETEKKAYNKAYAIICDADDGETGNGNVTFRVYKKPEITFDVGLKGV